MTDERRTTSTDLFAPAKPMRYAPATFDDVADERRHRLERLAARSASSAASVSGKASPGTHGPRPRAPRSLLAQPVRCRLPVDLRLGPRLRRPRRDDPARGLAINRAAFAIHSQVHAARPDVIAAAHTHSVHGKAFSALGQLLEPITQDACAFYQDHALFDDFTGVVLDTSEGKRIAHALGEGKAAILRNHGLLTAGHSVDEAAWWFITMERSCEAQLLAMAAGERILINPDHAATTAKQVGSHPAGWLSFQPLYHWIVREQPDLLD